MDIIPPLNFTTNMKFSFWKFSYEGVIKELTGYDYRDLYYDMYVREMYDKKVSVGEAVLCYIRKYDGTIPVSELLREKFGFVPDNILSLNTCYKACMVSYN